MLQKKDFFFTRECDMFYSILSLHVVAGMYTNMLLPIVSMEDEWRVIEG